MANVIARHRAAAARDLAAPVLFIVALKLLIFVVAAVLREGEALPALWQQWDAHWYSLIAEDGYVAEGEARYAIAFFPLYPLAIRLLTPLVGDAFWAALLLSNVASVAGLLLFYRLARLEFSASVAWWALLALLLWPTAYFFNAPYTEGLFLLLSVGAFVAARRSSWLLAGVLGGLAALTRVTGVLLLPALAVEFYLQQRERGERRYALAWPLALIGLGFGIYLLINYQVFGDPFAFLDAQREKWYRSFAWPGAALASRWRDIGLPPWTEYNVMQGLAEFSAGAVLIAAMIWSVLRLRWSYALYVVLVTGAILSSSWIMSTPRLALSAWPIFFLFGQLLVRRPGYRLVWLGTSVALLLTLTARYVQGQWAF